MTVVEPTTRRWTREEYYRLAEMGMFHGQRVEFIDGEIIQMPAQKGPHYACISAVQDALREIFGAGCWVRTQAPLHLLGFAPEPDVAVVVGTRRDYADHPESAILIVEVSDTTLTYDRTRKASLYAAAGVPDYWIVNLVARQIEVRREPVPDENTEFGFRYGAMTIVGPGQNVAPLAAPSATIPVDDLLL